MLIQIPLVLSVVLTLTNLLGLTTVSWLGIAAMFFGTLGLWVLLVFYVAYQQTKDGL